MKKVLIATPMMPPSAGGPATHAKKLFTYFGGNPKYSVSLFNFEQFNKFPAGIRHLFAFFSIFKLSLGNDVILCLDGFSVALPATLVAKILRKKIYLRIGGDLVHEQYVETAPISMDVFYEELSAGTLVPPLDKGGLGGVKLKIQKFVLENADKVIFTTNWQKQICEKFYKLPKGIFILNNPIEKIDKSIYENFPYQTKSELTFTSITRPVAFKNQAKVIEAINLAKSKFPDIYFENQLGSWESCLKRISVSHAYICASISDISPNQVLESLSLGVPVIMTKNTGFYELLKDSGVVRFIDPYSAEDLRQAIEEMCDGELYRGYKMRLQTFLESNLWPETWESLLLKYEEILNN